MASYTVVIRDSRILPNKERADGSFTFPSEKQEYDLTEATSEIFRDYSENLQ